jgi:hypothetical protein
LIDLTAALVSGITRVMTEQEKKKKGKKKKDKAPEESKEEIVFKSCWPDVRDPS